MTQTINVPRHIFRSIARLPIHFIDFMGRHDVDPRAYYWPQTEIELETYHKLWQALAEESKNPLVAMSIGAHLWLEDFDLFEYSLMDYEFMAEAIVPFAQHYEEKGYGKFRVSDGGDRISVMFQPMQNVPSEHEQCIMLHFVSMLRLLTDHRIESKRSGFRVGNLQQYRYRENDKAGELYLGGSVLYNSRRSFIEIKEEDLERPIIWQDNALKPLVEKGDLPAIRRHFAKNRLEQQFWHGIDEAMVFHDMDIKEIICHLEKQWGTDEFTAQLPLDKFDHFVDELRRDWALKHMEQQYRDIELFAITNRLCYRNPEAIKWDYPRWTGQNLCVSTIIVD